MTQDSQSTLDQASNVKARSAELLHVSIEVEPVQFNTGHHTVDITYYYRILVDAIICGTRPCTLCGLAMFSKRVILCGGEGNAKIFTSKTTMTERDRHMLMSCNKPEAVVEVVDPIILASKVVDVCNCRCNDRGCMDIPAFIAGCFDADFVTTGEERRLYVTLGQFSIIRMERDTQLRIPNVSYCVPNKDCSATGGVNDDSPCDLFGRIDFPVGSFFPPCGSGECGSLGGVDDDSCKCNSGCGSNGTNHCKTCR